MAQDKIYCDNVLLCRVFSKQRRNLKLNNPVHQFNSLEWLVFQKIYSWKLYKSVQWKLLIWGLLVNSINIYVVLHLAYMKKINGDCKLKGFNTFDTPAGVLWKLPQGIEESRIKLLCEGWKVHQIIIYILLHLAYKCIQWRLPKERP